MSRNTATTTLPVSILTTDADRRAAEEGARARREFLSTLDPRQQDMLRYEGE